MLWWVIFRGDLKKGISPSYIFRWGVLWMMFSLYFCMCLGAIDVHGMCIEIYTIIYYFDCKHNKLSFGNASIVCFGSPQ